MPSTNPLDNFDTLANGMAHAIRNPLSSILTASTLVAEDANVTEETRMLLDVIVRESRHLNRIFSDFLEYVRPVKLEPAVIDVAALARRIATQMQRDGVLHEVEISLDTPLEVWADEDSVSNALRQILLNAAVATGPARAPTNDTNTDHASAAFGKISVSGNVSGETVQIVIDDDGPGLTPRQLERGFDPFFSDTADGTGLGLPLARAAMSAANGTLALDNRANERGARAVLSFPKAKR